MATHSRIEGKQVRATFSYPLYEQLRAANQTLTDLVASAPIGSFNVVVNGSAEIATSFGVSGNYFRVLRVPAAIGRVIEETDDEAGRATGGACSATRSGGAGLAPIQR